MEKVKKYKEYSKLNEDGEGGGAPASGGDGGSGTAYATLGQNGMGNIVSPQVGTSTGSVWQSGSGTIGSGDKPAYDMKNKFDKIKNDDDEKGKKKGKIVKKPKVIMKYTDFLMGPKN